MTPAAAAPVRSDEQRMTALARANEIRVLRSHLKRDLTIATALDVLLDPPEYAHGMKVIDLLRSMPKWGTVKAQRCLNSCRVSHHKTIGGLSGRQRRELAAAVRS